MVGAPARRIPSARDGVTAAAERAAGAENIGRLPLCFKMLAALKLAASHPGRAVRLGAAAQRYTEEIGGDLAEVFGQLGDPVQEARPLLGPAEHALAVEEGWGMSLEEHIAYALAPESGSQTGVL